MKKEVYLLSVLGVMHRHKKGSDLELLPPPPPFPDLDDSSWPDAAPTDSPKPKTRIKIAKPQEDVEDILGQAAPTPEKNHHLEVYETPLTTEHQEEHWSMELSHEADIVHPVMEDERNEIDSAISSAKRPEPKPSFWRRLFVPRQRMAPREEPAQEKSEPQWKEALDQPAKATGVEGAMALINKARQLVMNLELSEAKEAYIEIMKSYRMMTEDEQKQVYEAIKELYDERAAAESLHLK